MDENYEPYQNDMDEVMRLHGYSYGEDWITKKIEGAGHYPKEWRKRLDMPLTLLLSKINRLQTGFQRRVWRQQHNHALYPQESQNSN